MECVTNLKVDGSFFYIASIARKSIKSILFTIVSPLYILSIFELYQWIAESKLSGTISHKPTTLRSRPITKQLLNN